MNSFLRLWARVFEGRVNRMQFFLAMLVNGIVFSIVTLGFIALTTPEVLQGSPFHFYTVLRSSSFMWTLFPLYFLQGIFSVGLSVRRLKDCNITPLVILISFLPYMSAPLFIFLLVKKGTPGTNQFGPAPTRKRSVLEVLLNN
ncbi:MAG TPA: DUF805 domain-containing protein [Candidatus Paceibacterota bacterium]